MKYLILILFLPIVSWANQISDIVETNKSNIDTNGDSKDDYFRSFSKKGRISEIRKDRNFDQKIDEISSYKDNGRLIVNKRDNNFDGYFEETHNQEFDDDLISFEKINRDENNDRKDDFILERTYFPRSNVYYEYIQKDPTFSGNFSKWSLKKYPWKPLVAN